MSNKQNFIDKANQKYNFKFDYSKFYYINAKTKSIIICPEHGEFEQNPDKHLNSKFACKICEKKYKIKSNRTGIVNEKLRITKEEFSKKFYSKYGTKYRLILDDYSGITGSKVGVECGEHGISMFYPNNIRNVKCPCLQCSHKQRAINKTKSYDYIVEQLNLKYNFKYEYPISNEETYKNKRSKIKILCREHGEFIKSAQNHLAGQECFQCKINELINSGKFLGGYSIEYFINNPLEINKPCILYYIKVGNLYKIGITTNLTRRISSIKSQSKKEVDIIYTREYNLYNGFQIEQQILNDFKEYRVLRRWSTELFEMDIREQILTYF